MGSHQRLSKSDRSIARLRKLREKWLCWFEIGKKNSIALQLTNITWDITCFKIVDEAIRCAPESTDGGRELNGAVFNLVVRCFGKGLMVDIRKLVDTSDNCISLKRLLSELKENCSLLTRKNVFSAEAVDYDPAERIRREMEFMEAQQNDGQSTMYGLRLEESSDKVTSRHEQLDFLCQVQMATRTPADCIHGDLLQHLIDVVDQSCRTVKQHVDQNIAHAQQSKVILSELTTTPTWIAVYDAHSTLCKVAGFVHFYILGASQLLFAPLSGGEMLAYTSRPLLNASDMEHVNKVLQAFWDQ